MKKLSLLVALALLITVGGVYATWDYAQREVSSSTTSMPGSVQMAAMTNSTAKGKLIVTHDQFTVWVDDDNKNHRPDLTYGTKVDGSEKDADEVYIALHFTPAQGADPKVVEGAISLNYWFTTSEGIQQYNGNDLYTINANESNKATISWGTADTDPTGRWEKNGDGSFTLKLTVTELLGISHDENGEPTNSTAAVVLNNNFKLSNVDLYEQYNTILDSGYLVLHVEENVAPAVSNN